MSNNLIQNTIKKNKTIESFFRAILEELNSTTTTWPLLTNQLMTHTEWTELHYSISFLMRILLFFERRQVTKFRFQWMFVRFLLITPKWTFVRGGEGPFVLTFLYSRSLFSFLCFVSNDLFFDTSMQRTINSFWPNWRRLRNQCSVV